MVHAVRESGVGVKKKRVSKFEHECRNGHPRTEANTCTRGGRRQCTDCPGWQRNQLSTNKRRAEAEDASPEERYYRVLSAAELAHLRGLIPCVSCAAPYGAAHDYRCRVPFNIEDDGTAESDRKKMRAA